MRPRFSLPVATPPLGYPRISQTNSRPRSSNAIATGSMTSVSHATSSTLKPGSVLKVLSSSLGLSGSAISGGDWKTIRTDRTNGTGIRYMEVLSVSLCEHVHFRNNQFLDLWGPLRRHAVVDLRRIGFIAALFQHAGRRNVGHHVVRVRGDPYRALPANLLLDAPVVVDDDLATEGDPRELVAKAPDVDRVVRVVVGKLAAAVEDLEHVLRPFLDRVGLAQRVGRPLVFPGDRFKGQFDLGIFRDHSGGERGHLRGELVLHGDRELFAVLLAQLDLAPRERVGIGAAADPEEGQRAGVLLLDLS